MKHFCFDTLLSRLCTADNQEHCCLVIIFHQTLPHDVYSTFPSSPSSWLQISQIATERVISMNFNTKIHSNNTICKKSYLSSLFSDCQMPILSSSAFQNHDGTPEFPVVRITNDGPGTQRRECAKKVPSIFWFPSQSLSLKIIENVSFNIASEASYVYKSHWKCQ